MNGRSEKSDKRSRWLCRVFAAAGMGLAIAGSVSAQPRAELLPPVVAKPYVPRASSEPILPENGSPPSGLKRPNIETEYPPTFSSRKPSLWNRFVGVFSGDDDKKPPTEPTPKPTANQPVLPKPAIAPIEGVPANAQPAHPLSVGRVIPPAWNWYGYGAPVPGSNSLAPTGRYGFVQPWWYTQTGATPGAIPKVGVPVQGPELPPPIAPSHDDMNRSSAGPLNASEVRREQALPGEDSRPANATRQADLQVPATGPRIESGKPATIEPPVKSGTQQGDPKFTPILPVSSRHAEHVSRAQSPEAALVPSAVIAILKSTCSGYTTRIDVMPKGPRHIGLHLTLIPGVLPDRLADRIAKLPELAGWEIEMQFAH